MTDTTLSELRQLLSQRPTASLEGPGCNPAAVLLLIYPKDGDYCVNLQKRTKWVEQHKGEVCLPGGKPEPSDGGLLKTALRETQEEVGIRPKDVTVLGQMDDVFTRTGYTLKVFVGTIPYPYDFTSNSAEVEEVLEVPLSVLRDPANWREEAWWERGNLTRRYAYAYGSHLIYGATARIVGQFLDLMEHPLRNGRP